MNNKKNFLEAGVNIIAKLKRKPKDVIIPQNVAYKESEQKSENDTVYKVKNPTPYEFEYVPPTKQEEAKQEVKEEKTFPFDDISTKLENIKKSLLDVLAEREAKRNELLNSGLKKEDLQKELDKTVTELDEKLNIIYQMLDKASDTLVSFDTAAKNNYSEISENLKAFSENAEKTELKIENIAGTLDEAKRKVGEIHETTASIDKLYDSVFELKTANVENKNAIDAFNVSAKKRFRLLLTFGLVFGAISIGSLILAILILLK